MNNLKMEKWIEQITEILNNYNNFDILKNSNEICKKIVESQNLLLDAVKL